MLFAKLGIRNVLRNTRRTLITLAAMTFGTTAIILFGGFVNAAYVGVREQTILAQTGHIQLYKRGFSEKGAIAPFEYMIDNFPEVRDLVAKLEHVRVVAPRLGFSGLISTGETTTAFVGIGVDPAAEARMSSSVRIVGGRDLAPDDPNGAMLGLGLAEGLGVKIGSDLTLLATTKDGAINALAAKASGVWQSGEKAYDDRFLRVPIAQVQRLLDVEGAVQSAVILLDETDNTDQVAVQLASLIQSRGLALEMKTWKDLALRYHQVRQLLHRIFTTLIAIVAVIVVLGVANTMTMAIFERTREIGTIMALGTKRRGMIAMFILEGLTLGVMGGVVGVTIGVLVAKLVSSVGIPMPPPPGSTQGFTAHIMIVPGVLLQAFLLSLVTAVVSSIYPAWRASRLNIVDALRHV